MAQRNITVKIGKKKPGTISRAKVRRVVAEVYAIPLAKLPPADVDSKVIITRG
jgi:hypothetical protein